MLLTLTAKDGSKFFVNPEDVKIVEIEKDLANVPTGLTKIIFSADLVRTANESMAQIQQMLGAESLPLQAKKVKNGKGKA